MYCSFDPVLMLIVERPQVAWEILISYPSFNAPVISAFLLFGLNSHPMKCTHLHRQQQMEERLQTVCWIGVSDRHQICSRTISRCMFPLVHFVVDSDSTFLNICLVNSNALFQISAWRIQTPCFRFVLGEFRHHDLDFCLVNSDTMIQISAW